MPKGIYTRVKPVSVEARTKMSNAHRGKKSGMFGKKHKQETKDMLSELHKLNGVGKWMKGRKLSDKTRLNISEAKMGSKNPAWKFGDGQVGANRRWILNPENYQRKIFMNENRRLLSLSIKGSHTLEQWVDLKKKYGHICLCCKKREPEITLSKDHIVPITKGGTNFIENIQPLCRSCNSIKGNRLIINYKITQ